LWMLWMWMLWMWWGEWSGMGRGNVFWGLWFGL
jgi:hypothetical protein